MHIMELKNYCIKKSNLKRRFGMDSEILIMICGYKGEGFYVPFE